MSRPGIEAIDSPGLYRGLLVYVLIVGGFLMLPLVLAVMLAFSSGGGLEFPPPGLSFKWIVKAAVTREFREGLIISTIVAGATGLISAIAGTAAAIAINHYRFSVAAVSVLLVALSLAAVPFLRRSFRETHLERA